MAEALEESGEEEEESKKILMQEAEKLKRKRSLIKDKEAQVALKKTPKV